MNSLRTGQSSIITPYMKILIISAHMTGSSFFGYTYYSRMKHCPHNSILRLIMKMFGEDKKFPKRRSVEAVKAVTHWKKSIPDNLRKFVGVKWVIITPLESWTLFLSPSDVPSYKGTFLLAFHYHSICARCISGQQVLLLVPHHHND